MAAAGQAMLAGFATDVAADGKVTVNFKHAGDAPILKKSTFKLPAATTLATVADQLRKQLQLAPHDPLVRPTCLTPSSESPIAQTYSVHSWAISCPIVQSIVAFHLSYLL